MYCSKCGKQNDDNAKVCKYCGYPLASSLTQGFTTPIDALEGQTTPLNAGIGKGSILNGRYEIISELGRGHGYNPYYGCNTGFCQNICNNGGIVGYYRIEGIGPHRDNCYNQCQ